MPILTVKYFKVYFPILFLLSILLTGRVAAFSSGSPLPIIKNIKSVVDKTSIGFEWPPIKDARVKGIHVYRALAKPGNQQRYVRIATVGNRYATHFVDNKIKPSVDYFYTFTTFSGLDESSHGEIVHIHTQPPFKAVKFVEAARLARDIAKLLWIPHPNPRIFEYIIQRRRPGQPWRYLATVKGRLNPEYVDMTLLWNKIYDYRVIARSADGVASIPSKTRSVDEKRD